MGACGVIEEKLYKRLADMNFVEVTMINKSYIIILTFLLTGSILLYSCTWFEQQSKKTKQGTGIGAAVGGLAGLIIDSSNPWRGGIIGAAIGAVSGGVIGNIIEHSAQQAAHNNKSVKYNRTVKNGTSEEIEATPHGSHGSYKLVTVKYVRDGKVVGEEVKKVPSE
jgi:hypothetical protein